MSWIIGIIAAIALGVLTNVVYELIKYGTIGVPRRLKGRAQLSPAAREHDVMHDGLFPFVTWSAVRPLTPERLVTSYVGRPHRSHLFDVPKWHEHVSRYEMEGEAGRTAYPVGEAIDHDEHSEARQFRVVVGESTYAESLATQGMANGDAEMGRELLQALEGGFEAFLVRVPPTSLTASVAVIASSGRFLALRRSLSVRTFRAQWTIGVNETMKYVDEPGAEEDFYGLVGRALKEELGLNREDYGPVVISWFGWSQPAASFLVVATIKSRLSEAMIEERRNRCHSIYEHDSAAWLPLRAKDVSAVIVGGPCPDGTNRWSYLAPLLAREMWRMHGIA